MQGRRSNATRGLCATSDAATGRAPPRPIGLRPFCSPASSLHSGHIDDMPTRLRLARNQNDQQQSVKLSPRRPLAKSGAAPDSGQ